MIYLSPNVTLRLVSFLIVRTAHSIEASVIVDLISDMNAYASISFSRGYARIQHM